MVAWHGRTFVIPYSDCAQHRLVIEFVYETVRLMFMYTTESVYRSTYNEVCIRTMLSVYGRTRGEVIVPTSRCVQKQTIFFAAPPLVLTNQSGLASVARRAAHRQSCFMVAIKGQTP